MVPHLGLMNLCDYYRTERHVTENDCLSQTISPGFDPIHEEIWPALTSGVRDVCETVQRFALNEHRNTHSVFHMHSFYVVSHAKERSPVCL